jgi:hypothetical protein
MLEGEIMQKRWFELSIDNIIKYGDTDIFPFPIENHIFYDKKQKVIEVLQDLDSHFEETLETLPPINITTWSPLGYTGFRWVTQIDPLWNAYFLALVLSIADKIESGRIPKQENVVFSYRYKPDFQEGSLYDIDWNWMSFQTHSYESVKNSNYNFVVTCDIADFYNRIDHHRLENALKMIGLRDNAPRRIMALLRKFSGLSSYGLPIGGPAARILAELILIGTDKILKMEGIRFCRFVDDFYLFATSYEEAHSHLNKLAIKLLKNEGLTLQMYKTRILTKAEFKNLIETRINAETPDKEDKVRAQFMNFSPRFDPYSPTAKEDYERLKSELKSFDVMGLLSEELRKSKIHQQFCIRLIKSFNVLEERLLSEAFIAISDKFEILYPIFPVIMITASANFDRLNNKAKETLTGKLRELVRNESYIVQADLNAAYLLKVLAKEDTPENEETVNKIYQKFPESILVRSIIIQIMARWRVYPWLQQLRPNFQTMNKWERRIFIPASYLLGDEGKQFRRDNKKSFSKFEHLIDDWASGKIHRDPHWEIPL